LSGSANEKTSNPSRPIVEEIGHFLYGDIPKKIVQIITSKEDKNKKPIVEVEWAERRSDPANTRPTKPHNSFFTIN